MIWNPQHETMPRGELEKLQLERLKEITARVYEKVPFYRRAFQELAVSPESIHSLADVSKLPFTTKQDFLDNYPFELLTVPQDQVVRL
ncbi:MAG: phenylacetate--CoA ligase, partial [Dehalococcoidia bacterium]